MKNFKLLLLVFLLPLAAFAQPQIMTVLRNGIVGERYSEPLLATEAAEWSLVSGSLPPGLNVSNPYPSGLAIGFFSGIISGTLTTTGTYTFTLRAMNSAGSDTKSFTINVIMPETPEITTVSLPNGIIGKSYSQLLKAMDYANWSLISSSLPSGITMNSSGSISGTPTAEGTYSFTVKTENVTGNDTKSFTITVVTQEPTGTPEIPRITTISLLDCKVGLYCARAFSSAETAEWSIENGSLPPGLGLSGSYISGTPTEAGEYTFTVRAENVSGSDMKTFTINVVIPEHPEITTSSQMNGIVGQLYNWSLSATESVSWSFENGSLSPSFTINSSGLIQGYITTVGEYTFTVKAENTAGSDTKTFTVNVTMPEPPEITTNSITNFKIGQSYDIFLKATEPAFWSIESGRLPPGLGEDFGLSLKNGSGSGYVPICVGGFDIPLCISTTSISGTPTKVGEYTFTLKAENLSGSDTKTFTVNVEMPEPPEITTDFLPDGIVGKSYSKSLKAADYANWSLVSGDLPPGVKVNYSGSISGIPTTAGEYTFTVKAENAVGSDTRQLSIKINPDTPEPEPIRLPRIANVGSILVHATLNAILLQNLPLNAKIELYNLQGKRIYSSNSGNSQILRIPVQTKGMYIVKIANQTIRTVVR
jgi:PKD repeat protein